MSEIVTPKRVVSKQTKLLFIAFGAASIASVCIVYTAPDREALIARRANAEIRLATPAQPAK